MSETKGKTKKGGKTEADKTGRERVKQRTFEAYVRFKAMPEVFRDKEYGYHTDVEFAKRFKVSRDTLWEWKQSSDFTKGMQILQRLWGKEKTPDLIASLYRKGLKEGNAAEIKLWLEYIDEWKPGMILHTPEMVSALKERTKLLRELVEQEKTKTKKI